MTGTAGTVPMVNKTQSNCKTSFADLKALARGRWPCILAYYGMPSECFSGKHIDCPMPSHGGKKDFRFDNRNGDGSHICTCSSSADGFNLLSTFLGIENQDAIKLVSEYFSKNNTPIRPNYAPIKEKAQSNDNEKALAKKRAGYHSDKILSKCENKPHPYLQDKGIDKPVFVIKENYRVNETQVVYRGAFIVPVCDVGNPEVLIGVQCINPDGQRFYVKDTKIEDGINVIDGDSNLPYVDVVEGMATGISANMATGATTIVAFDANGVKGKAERIKKLFSGKQLRFLGDNDSHKGWIGNRAANTAAFKTGGVVAIPLVTGKDWDDHRKANGIEATQKEISNLVSEYNNRIEINERIIGLSLTSSIFIKSKNEAVSFDDALINYSGTYCICPISGGNAVINPGGIYSFELQKHIAPTLANLYDKDLISKCKAIRSLKGRLKWVSVNGTQKHIYAFVSLIHHRLGTDIPNHYLFNEWLYKKTKVNASPGILNLVRCLQESRVNQARRLTKLDHKEFKHHIKLRQERKEDGTSRLKWEPAIDAAKSGKYKLVAIKAQHGQGKTQEFIKSMMEHANTYSGGMVIAHRRKLIAQIANDLNCHNYEDYSENKRVFSGLSLTSIKGMAICIHSLKHEHFLSYQRQAHSIFIDEASQVLKALFLDKNIKDSIQRDFPEATKNAQCIYLTDADLTSQDIKHYQQLFSIKDDEILVVYTENPERNYFAEISCSSAPRHYRTKVIQSITKDLQNGKPCVLAVESEALGKSAFKYFKDNFPERNIWLLTSKTPKAEIDHFVGNAIQRTSTLDLFIHTSVIGTGVSIQHEDKRFKKGYGLFSGSVLSATECLQMMRRFRDIAEWEIGLLCKPESMFMTSFYNNLGSKALSEHNIETSSVLSDITLNNERSKAFFIHAFTGLLRDEYGFKIIGQFAINESIDGMMTTDEVREEEKQRLIKATPLPLDKALLARKREYKDDDERYSSEAAICADYFKSKQVTVLEAELWCSPAAKGAIDRQESIIKTLRLDPSIHKVQEKHAILTKAGITISLFKKQRLSQEHMKSLTESVSSHCAELVGLGLLRERYSKESKIPKERPIKFVREFLEFIGLNVETVETRANGRERQLDISVPLPMVSRLGIDARTEKEVLKEKALKLRSEGLGYGHIAKELGLKDKHLARRLLGT